MDNNERKYMEPEIPTDWVTETTTPQQRSYARKKARSQSFYECLDCRALIGDKVAKQYDTCPFCEGANWSDLREWGSRRG